VGGANQPRSSGPGAHRRVLSVAVSVAATSAFERGVAAYNADDIDAAADAFEEAVRLAPDEAEAHINLGLVYLRLQRSADAMRELETGAALTRGERPAEKPQR
jgi:Flp pilus assembly protein TadD